MGAEFFQPMILPNNARIETFHLEPGIRHHVSMLVASHGLETPFVLTRPGSGNENEHMVNVKMDVVHFGELVSMSGLFAWDELSGRLCVASNERDAIVVLDF